MEENPYGRPGWVRMQSSSEHTEFPDDPQMMDPGAQDLTQRKIAQGETTRRSKEES